MGELVKYFEDGCLCLHKDKLSKPSNEVKDAEKYYLDNCKCSRHPESATRECWDRK